MPGASLFLLGVRRVLRRPGLLVGMWLLSLVAALLAALPAGLLLFTGLADRPAVGQLARGQADGLFVEFFFGDNGAPELLLSALLVALLFWLVEVLLSGGVLSALLRPGHPAYAPPGRVVLRAAESAGNMLRLELLGVMLLRLPLLLVAGVAAYLIGSRTHIVDATAEVVVLRFAPLVVVVLVLWSLFSVVLQYARLLRLSPGAPKESTLRALGQALKLAFETGEGIKRTLFLGLISLLGYGLLIFFGRVAAARLDYGLFVGLAFIVRQAFAFFRTGLALSVMAAATEVWHHHVR